MSEFDFESKKKKSSKNKSAETDVDGATDKTANLSIQDNEKEGVPNEGGEPGFDFKKKRKKKKAADTAVNDFDAQLQQAGVNVDGEVDQEITTVTADNDVSDKNKDFTYAQLLSRFFDILRENNPDLVGDRSGVKYKIPPPSVMREGNKKTLFANVKEISERMHRPTEHVIQFLFAELGTSGSVDGASRLVIKGRFQQKQLETVLRRYILEYVTCKTCKSVNTRLTKENRLYFLDCSSCGSRRSVTSIKTGYQAQIGRRIKK